MGGFSLLFVDKMLMINELEFDDVMKKNMIISIVRMLVIVLIGKLFSNWKSDVLVFIVLLMSMLLLLCCCNNVELLKIVNYSEVIMVGMSSIVLMNFWIVCFCEICVMNILINGV